MSMQFRNNLRTQSRGDKQIDLTNFNEAMRKIDALGIMGQGNNGIQYIRWNGSGRMVVPKNFIVRVKSFADRRIALNKVRILTGDVEVAGVSQFTVAQTDLTLSAATEWIFVEFAAKSPTTGTIKNQANEPKSSTALIQRKLVRYVKEGNAWNFAQLYHDGDINMGTPLSTE